jgi:hypothetical protein
MMKRNKLYLLALLFLAACSPLATPQSGGVLPAPSPTQTPQVPEVATQTTDPTGEPQVLTTAPSLQPTTGSEVPTPVPTNVRIEDDKEYRIPSMLPFDAIFPVYDPQFLHADQASLQDDELVMGLAIGGEAKAYPVTVLRFREMVNDEIAGWPVLVTW